MLPLRDTEANEKFPIATLTIILLNIMVFIRKETLPYDETMELIYNYAYISSRFTNGILYSSIY